VQILTEAVESLTASYGKDDRGNLGWLVPRGLLLCGPPGVGKTHSVRQAAKALAPQIEVGGASMLL